MAKRVRRKAFASELLIVLPTKKLRVRRPLHCGEMRRTARTLQLKEAGAVCAAFASPGDGRRGGQPWSRRRNGSRRRQNVCV